MKLASLATVALILSTALATAETYVIQGQRARTSAAVLDAGATPIVRSNLRADHVLAVLDARQLRAVVASGATVFPASEALTRGVAVPVCPLIQAYALDGGWCPDKDPECAVSYSFGTLASGANTESMNRQAAIDALNTWGAAVKVAFSETTDRKANRSIDIGIYDLSIDPMMGGVLAYAYIPSIQEPWAGDIHVNGFYTWDRYNTYDLRSMLLHEEGHSIGLGHVNDSSSVMYPYYSGMIYPSWNDVLDIRELYAPNNGVMPGKQFPVDQDRGGRDTGGGTTTPAPLALSMTISAPTSTVEAEAMVYGTITGGTAPYHATWTAGGQQGSVAVFGDSYSTMLPLCIGDNTISVAVTDSAGATVTAQVQITRTQGGRSGR